MIPTTNRDIHIVTLMCADEWGACQSGAMTVRVPPGLRPIRSPIEIDMRLGVLQGGKRNHPVSSAIAVQIRFFDIQTPLPKLGI